MAKLEHIGIAVNSLKDAMTLYENILCSDCYKVEVVESEKVTTAFIKAGDTKIELLESATPDGVIAQFIKKRGEGLHHIAFEVPDILVEMKRLKKEGFELLMDKPKKGADNKLICFLHPKTSGGVLIEICQEIR